MFPRDVSGDGFRVDDTLRHALGSMYFTFAVAVVALAVLVVRNRARGQPLATVPHPSFTRGTSIAAALIALTVFVGIDLRLALRARSDLTEHLWRFPRGDNVVRLEVLARQWSWQCRNPGPDGQFGTADDITALDDLVVPIGRPVSVQLRAIDVVHGFFLPEFRVRQDAIPGRVTRTWFRPVQRGTFQLLCGQFCGQGHYRMHGRVRVLSATDYARWLRDASADALRAHAGTRSLDRTAWTWID